MLPETQAFVNDADWRDRFEAELTSPDLTANEIAVMLLANPPGWIQGLMRLRNAVVTLVGLKTVRMAAGASVGGFPVVEQSPSHIVLGFDDKHLDFRIIVDVFEDDPNKKSFGVSTYVRRHNLLGHIYMMFVAPFHRRIVPATMRPVGRNIHPVQKIGVTV
ncbi:DUF2867 domain-containing protein [Rhizobium alvei]|uniref:DUF2867 domain-containing protein n=1 Tax=Rhizobium alvei TaxID=1132659 RepID=A0ABT8YNF6_9HYPH|nr:DUF2867 domain-containing protein [Rhizobium alvei]MDO6964898.1 DUF2867 domain-containing protein [Rhizobium alvei]